MIKITPRTSTGKEIKEAIYLPAGSFYLHTDGVQDHSVANMFSGGWICNVTKEEFERILMLLRRKNNECPNASKKLPNIPTSINKHGSKYY